ncbi:hypothetical protein TNCV_2572671 [Trichonephila clavipes]|nr:hypothetical protein TNCV_2572671 [Trichonephila clavipes]
MNGLFHVYTGVQKLRTKSKISISAERRGRADRKTNQEIKPEETGGRQREKSLDTRHRRLDDRYRVLPWPEDCTLVVCLHDALYGVYL